MVSTYFGLILHKIVLLLFWKGVDLIGIWFTCFEWFWIECQNINYNVYR